MSRVHVSLHRDAAHGKAPITGPIDREVYPARWRSSTICRLASPVVRRSAAICSASSLDRRSPSEMAARLDASRAHASEQVRSLPM